MIIKNNQFLVLGALGVFLFSAALSSEVLAEQPASSALACGKKAGELQKKECPDHLKRKQLQTKKLSPQIRSEELKRDKEFDLNKLHPFIVGSGLVN